MTEAEWLACDDPITLVETMRGQVSARRMRLLGAACCRRLWPHLSEQSREVIEFGERLADGLAEEAERLTLRSLPSAWGGDAATRAIVASSPDAAEAAVVMSLSSSARILEDEAVQVGYAHCVFGNPFKAVSFTPAFRTPTVTTLATAAYEQRLLPSGQFDAARLAVLSDALEEAGCTDEALLSHLRSPGPHVRGCWALDLILGKE